PGGVAVRLGPGSGSRLSRHPSLRGLGGRRRSLHRQARETRSHVLRAAAARREDLLRDQVSRAGSGGVRHHRSSLAGGVSAANRRGGAGGGQIPRSDRAVEFVATSTHNKTGRSRAPFFIPVADAMMDDVTPNSTSRTRPDAGYARSGSPPAFSAR